MNLPISSDFAKIDKSRRINKSYIEKYDFCVLLCGNALLPFQPALTAQAEDHRGKNTKESHARQN